MRVRWKSVIDCLLNALDIAVTDERPTAMSAEFNKFFNKEVVAMSAITENKRVLALMVHIQHLGSVALDVKRERLESNRRTGKKTLREFNTNKDEFQREFAIFSGNEFMALQQDVFDGIVDACALPYLFRVVGTVCAFLTPRVNDFTTLDGGHQRLRTVVLQLGGGAVESAPVEDVAQQPQPSAAAASPVPKPVSVAPSASLPLPPKWDRRGSKYPPWEKLLQDAISDLTKMAAKNYAIEESTGEHLGLQPYIDKEDAKMEQSDLKPHRRFSLLLLLFRNLYKDFMMLSRFEVNVSPCWKTFDTFDLHNLQSSAVLSKRKDRADTHLIASLLDAFPNDKLLFTYIRKFAVGCRIRQGTTKADCCVALATEYGQIGRSTSPISDKPMPPWYIEYVRVKLNPEMGKRIKRTMETQRKKLKKHVHINSISRIPIYHSDSDDDDCGHCCEEEEEDEDEEESEEEEDEEGSEVAASQSPQLSASLTPPKDVVDNTTKATQAVNTATPAPPVVAANVDDDLLNFIDTVHEQEDKSRKKHRRASSSECGEELPHKRKRSTDGCDATPASSNKRTDSDNDDDDSDEEPILRVGHIPHDIEVSDVPKCASCDIPFHETSKVRGRLHCRHCEKEYHYSYACLPESYFNGPSLYKKKKFVCPDCRDKPFNVKHSVVRLRRNASFWEHSSRKAKDAVISQFMKICDTANHEDALYRAALFHWRTKPNEREVAQKWYDEQSRQPTISSPPRPPS